MEKHIKQILQEVNTIIIPGIGALTVTSHTTGEIMFMPYLKYDDGKLASFIAEKEGITLDEAKAVISDDVSNILNTIEAGNSFNLNGIGSFKKDASGGIEFKSGIYDEENSIDNASGESQIKEEAIIEILENKVVEQIVEIPVIQEEIKLESDEDVISEEEPVLNESKKKGFFSMFNKDTVSSIESVDLEEEESDIAFEIELPKEEIVEKEVIQDVEKEEEISSPIEEILEVEELSVPEITIEASESIDKQDDNAFEVGSSESISENTISDEEFLADDEVITPVKKKKGVKFWVFTILILLIAGGGTFVGLNFEQYKKYLPLGSKTETIDISEEEKIIETLESDDTEPLKDKAPKTEEMIHSTPEEVKVVEEITPEPKTEQLAVETSSDEQLKSEPVHKNKPKAKSYSKVKMEDVQVQSISDGSFYIILGTFAEKVSAVGQVEMLLTKGKKGASVIERDNKFSVSYGTYSSIEEAKAKLDEAKAAYNHAWILHK
jgi:hypothetical protein